MDDLLRLPALSSRAELIWQNLLKKYHHEPTEREYYQPVRQRAERTISNSVFESSQMSGSITWTQDHQRQRLDCSIISEDPLTKQHPSITRQEYQDTGRQSHQNTFLHQALLYQTEDSEPLSTPNRPRSDPRSNEPPSSVSEEVCQDEVSERMPCMEMMDLHVSPTEDNEDAAHTVNRHARTLKDILVAGDGHSESNHQTEKQGKREESSSCLKNSLIHPKSNSNVAKDHYGTFQKMLQASKSNKEAFRKPTKTLVSKKRKHPPESEADKALSDIEQIMTSSEKKKQQKASFAAPFKNVQKSSLESANTDVRCVADLGEEERDRLKTHLTAAAELALTLTYTDGSSLLGPPPGQAKTKKSSQQLLLKGLVMAFPRTDGAQPLDFIRFQLEEKDGFDTWSREVLCKVLQAKSRKICYRADELIVTLQKLVGFNLKEGPLEWCLLDPGVAFWLLHSDHPARCFNDVVAALPDISSKVAKDTEGETTVDRLRLLGPAMAQLYRLLKSAHLWDMFLNLETPLTPILAAMHLRGIKVDTTELVKTADLLERKLSQLEEAAHMAAGRRFSLNSHPQLRQVLFEDLKLDKKLNQGSKIARTLVEGQKSTSQSVLLQLKGTHELPAIVLEYRQLQKLKSTYVDGLLTCVEPSGWVHARWTQVSASTGRLAATQPNLQAVPKLPVVMDLAKSTIVGKSPEQVSIFARDPFHSQPGYTLLAADFQQIEFRLLAHLCSDQALLSIFNENPETDIFIQLTAQWLSKLPSEVTAADREQTKRVVYSVIYGAGKERLSEYLKIEADEAKDIIQSFLVTYPGVNAFTKSCISEAQRQGSPWGSGLVVSTEAAVWDFLAVVAQYPLLVVRGYQTTLFGRRRLLPHIHHPAHNVRAQAERQAVNFCVQGSAADLCKAAMIMVERALTEKPQLEARLLLQIHDELLFEVKDEHLQEAAGLIKTTMEDRESLCGSQVRLQVPLPVSVSCGHKWGHLDSYRVLPPRT